jgi:cysteine-rich repeat protein
MTRLATLLLFASACGPSSEGVTPQRDTGPAARHDAGSTGALCGNGIVEAGEACDDGNRFDDDECNNNCASASCGDGEVNPNLEDCDDANRIDDDACRNDCSHARCGDGIRRTDLAPGARGFEGCDDANEDSSDACLNDCQEASCGDGEQRRDLAEGELGFEACDDGNRIDNDDCSNACQSPQCGDGITSALEDCDDGNAVDEDACLSDCNAARCGDGIQRLDLQSSEPGSESCDDANLNNADSCTNACALARCGDRIVRSDLAPGAAGYENCDDGNQNDADACSNACVTPICGNGQIEAGETCDDGNQINTDACLNSCVLAVCGDAVLRQDLAEGAAGFEGCDDGNQVDSDGCLNACSVARCGDGVRRADVAAGAEGYEVCDDGNEEPADACANCRSTCATHANCPGAYGRCRVAEGAQRGACYDLRSHACQSNDDCEFTDAAQVDTRTDCENNRCKVREFQTCIESIACIGSTSCTTVGQRQLCVQACQNTPSCATRYASCQGPQNAQYCWYNFCGANTELSEDFNTINNGNLGGACRADSNDPMDGHCYEVSATNNQWVGLCFEGGSLAANATCEWGVDRNQDARQCGGGLICSGYDNQGLKHCRPSCSQPGGHGSVTCAAGSACMAALHRDNQYVYGCVPQAEQCNVIARSSCGADGQCAILTVASTTSHCTPLAPGNERVAAAAACERNNQCPNGYYCNSNEGCRRVCLTDNDCDGQNTCSRSQGAAFGGCFAPAP